MGWILIFPIKQVSPKLLLGQEKSPGEEVPGIFLYRHFTNLLTETKFSVNYASYKKCVVENGAMDSDTETASVGACVRTHFHCYQPMAPDSTL